MNNSNTVMSTLHDFLCSEVRFMHTNTVYTVTGSRSCSGKKLRVRLTYILLILLNLSSAFDTIDFDLLCYVFERHLGISGTALKLLKSFLTGRSQTVIIDGVRSEIKKK